MGQIIDFVLYACPLDEGSRECEASGVSTESQINKSDYD